MKVKYSDKFERWDSWKQEYKYGVILITPPDPLFNVVNNLRLTYDPVSQAICPAHISLSLPLPQPLSSKDWQELKTITRCLDPILIHYGPLIAFPPYPGVVFSITPQQELNNLRIKIEQACIFATSPPRKYPFKAHLTVAEFISWERTEEIIRILADQTPQGSFRCRSLDYLIPDDEFHFQWAGTLEFKGMAV